MRLLLTSAGVSNASIHDALVSMIGKPIEASTALCIPTDPAYGSLNLAQAVQLIAYDWRQAQGGFALRERNVEPALASAAQVQGTLLHWREALVALGFLDPDAPRKLMPRLNQLMNRARLTTEEVNILRGIARAIQDRD